MEIKDRMDEFKASKNLSDKAFEKLIGSSNGSWRKAKSVSEDVLICFLDTFPEVSLEWLFRGKGQMLSDSRKEDKAQDRELLGLCKSLVSNYQQRDEVMSQLVSLVKDAEGAK